MRYLRGFNDSYTYKEENKPFSISYSFTNKEGIEFVVCFKKMKNSTYEREYFTTNRSKFGDINSNDVYGIMNSVTQITIDFIKKYKPKEIIIYHIPSQKERVLKKAGKFDYSTPTKRAILNKRFLERSIPSNYTYELRGSNSYIRLINNI